MSNNTEQQEQLEMGNRRSRSPAHEHATQDVAPKPAAGLNNDNVSRASSSSSRDNSSQTCSNNNKPFVADQLNAERRVVLQLRQGFGGCSVNKMHAAFEIFNVAKNVSSFCPLPPFKLKSKLLLAFHDYVLRGKVLTTVDRYALSRVTRIGDYFLCGCVYLKTIDLSPLSNVTSIGDLFLSNCKRLETIDLSPFSNVTRIGDYFLWECTDLMTVDLIPLSNVTAIGHRFLYECKLLMTVDLPQLSNVTTVGDSFLRLCSNLKTIDLSPLSKPLNCW